MSKKALKNLPQVTLPLNQAKKHANSLAVSFYALAEKGGKTGASSLALAQSYQEIEFLINQALTALDILSGSKKAG